MRFRCGKPCYIRQSCLFLHDIQNRLCKKTQNIRIEDFNYPLPDERIAKFPLSKRDDSKLLVYRKGEIEEHRFHELPKVLPADSLLVFNNTRVIQARLHFRKETGALIEVFCLEPLEPHEYSLSFQSTGSCSWLCLVGNLKNGKRRADPIGEHRR